MIGYNVIIVLSKDGKSLLMCRRKREPYKDLLNFVGGKIEKGEKHLSSAYRELFEETAITKKDIRLKKMLNIDYPFDNFYLEIYAGKLNDNIAVFGDENELLWVSLDENFFDFTKFAGDGNIGFILRQLFKHQNEILS